jgi:hypothetical protein
MSQKRVLRCNKSKSADALNGERCHGREMNLPGPERTCRALAMNDRYYSRIDLQPLEH